MARQSIHYPQNPWLWSSPENQLINWLEGSAWATEGEKARKVMLCHAEHVPKIGTSSHEDILQGVGKGFPSGLYPPTSASRLFSSSTISAASFATSAALSTEIPTSAA